MSPIADYLNRPLEFVWPAERRGFVREGLNAGECDLVAAIPSSAPMALATRPYYRSTYVFVSKPGEAPVASFDDPSPRSRKIRVQLIGDDGMNSPPAHALAERGIVGNVRGFMIYGDYRDDHPLSAIVHAVAAGEVDIAAVWGAIAGYFARKEQPPLVVTAIAGSPEARLPMTLDISIGVRKTDKQLYSQLDGALLSLAPQNGRICRSSVRNASRHDRNGDRGDRKRARRAPVDRPSLLQEQALFIDAIAKDLQAHPGHGLVLVGPSLANAAPLGVWINDRLGAPAGCFDFDPKMSAAGCAGACMSAGL